MRKRKFLAPELYIIWTWDMYLAMMVAASVFQLEEDHAFPTSLTPIQIPKRVLDAVQGA